MSVGLYSGTSGLALGVGLWSGVPGFWSGAAGLIDGLGAALDLNFLAGAPLDSRVTFSRGSAATLTDATGKITYAPNNSVLWSESFENASWSKVGNGAALAPTVTANAGAAPDGTTTADRIQFNCVDNTIVGNRSYISPLTNLTSTIGAQFVASVWVKAYDAGNVGKTIRFACDTIGSLVYTLTDSWQRIKINGTSVFATTNFLLETRGTFTTQTADVLVWGAQLEQVTYQTTPGTYVATTSSAYYGPRFDYDPVTLAPKGLLIEEQRSNLLTYSEQFDSAYWAATGATITANSVVSPDGTTNADTLVEDTSTGVHRVYATPACSASTTYTYTAYIKAAGRTQVRLLETTLGGAIFDLSTATVVSTDAGVTSEIQNAGNGWYRCRVTATTGGAQTIFVTQIQGSVAGNPNYTGNGATALYIWGAQLEAGSFATSYIPTVASQVTRSADEALIQAPNFASWFNAAEGTMVLSASVLGSPGAATVSFAQLSNGSSNNFEISLGMFDFSAPAFQVVNSTTQANLDLGSMTAGQIVNMAGAYKTNDFAGVLNGGTVQTDASGSIPSGISTLGIGFRLGGVYMNGHIRSLRYFPTRLTNAQLQALTA